MIAEQQVAEDNWTWIEWALLTCCIVVWVPIIGFLIYLDLTVHH